MTILYSLGMKLFLAWLAATGMTTEASCYQPMSAPTNTCYVVTEYRPSGGWQAMTYYWVGQNTYFPLFSRSR